MSYARIIILTFLVVTGCSMPKATVRQTSSTQFRATIEKAPKQFMEIIDVQLTDGNLHASSSFRLLDSSGKTPLLNTTGYGSFEIEIVTPFLSFAPDQALISYRLKEEGKIKSKLVSLQSIPTLIEANLRPTFAE